MMLEGATTGPVWEIVSRKWSSLLFGAILIVLFVWWRRMCIIKLLPCPTAWPFVGCLPTFAINLYRSGQTLPVYLVNMAKQYGPIFKVNICGSNIVVLCDYNSIKQAFQHPNLCDRPKSNLSTKLLGGDGVGLASGEIWKRQRRFTLTTFRSLGVGKSSFEQMITTECHKLIQEILRHEEKPFNSAILFSNAFANVICSFAFGRRYDYTDVDFQFLMHSIVQIDQRIREIGGAQLFIRFFQHIPSKRRTQLYKDTKALVDFINNIIAEHEHVFNPDNPRNYIDIFMKEIICSKDGLLTHCNRRGTVTGLFFAGSGTTSNTMRMAIYCMLLHPEVQMKVQAELDSVVGINRLPNITDKNSVPYTMATLLKIQRFGSTARFGPMHVASADADICGYHIPKGCYLLSNLWAVHHDPGIWSNPEQFNPSRFINEDGMCKQPKEFIPFGIGRRVCLGEAVAKMQLFIFFTNLLHQFTFVKPDESVPLPSVEGAKPMPDMLARVIPRSVKIEDFK